MLLAREIGLKKGMQVLEIGSGAGREALWFASSGVNCVALEINSKLCMTIKERLKRAKLWNVNAIGIRADGQNLPFRDATFDAVVCKALLHHVPNPLQSIIEMHRVAKKNGVVAAIDEPNALNPFRHIARFLVLYLHFRAYFARASEFLDEGTKLDMSHRFYRWQLQEYFEQAHFQSVKSECIWLPYVTFSRVFFKIWLLLERLVERTFIPYAFGQLFIIGGK